MVAAREQTRSNAPTVLHSKRSSFHAFRIVMRMRSAWARDQCLEWARPRQSMFRFPRKSVKEC